MERSADLSSLAFTPINVQASNSGAPIAQKPSFQRTAATPTDNGPQDRPEGHPTDEIALNIFTGDTVEGVVRRLAYDRRYEALIPKYDGAFVFDRSFRFKGRMEDVLSAIQSRFGGSLDIAVNHERRVIAMIPTKS